MKSDDEPRPDAAHDAAASRSSSDAADGGSPSVPTPSGEPTTRTRLSSLDRILIPLLTATIAVVAAVAGSYVGASKANEGAAGIQDRVLGAQLDSEARTKKADVYTTYLDAANEYAIAYENVNRCYRRWFDDPSRPPDAPQSCVNYLNAIQSPRYRYQGALNDVYTYGSDEAVDAARTLSATLPPSLGTLTIEGTGIPPFADIVQLPYDETGFSDAYRDFRAILCKEVPARPREGCGKR